MEDASAAGFATPFLMLGDDGKWSVNEAAAAYLSSLRGEVVVVAIAGKERTGKSSLLNQLIQRDGGFAVGPTVQACTKGVWLWGEALRAPGRDATFLFLDTEGLGATSRSESDDLRLFALALLLSSCLIYNSRGVIDGPALEQLSLVVRITQHIHVRSKSATDDDAAAAELAAVFPQFIWCVAAGASPPSPLT